MKKILFCLLCILPMTAGADVIYDTQQASYTTRVTKNSDAFASVHRFYLGAMYDFSMWMDYVGDSDIAHGKNVSGFDIVAGFRPYDIIRIEADYMNTRAKWDLFAINANTLFINTIVDARIDNLYRTFYKQHLVPYVGAGVGLTWTGSDDVNVKNDTGVSVAAMAGLGIECSEYFTIDLGYRYVYMFKPKIEPMPDLNPASHQIRAGVRVNF
ncbi:MAG: outer membrane beta-barrel protein [Alphaproteobacteria bacterium]|nr:outer membrane beta-barrel protein [Alphaproteobacteria bacterium]